jgi:methyl-accepting chemotaxis protein
VSQRLAEIATRLEELSAQLRDPQTDDERAQELAREAAELAAEAGSEAGRAVREAEDDEH